MHAPHVEISLRLLNTVKVRHISVLQAAQALEPAALIALHLLAPMAKVVLVGDPKQLPATVLSRAAEAGNLTQSLFERLQQVRTPFILRRLALWRCQRSWASMRGPKSARAINWPPMQAGWPVVMLSEQYRMHPAIKAWPARYFYDDRLVDGGTVVSGGCSADFHSKACFPPLAFFDCRCLATFQKVCASSKSANATCQAVPNEDCMSYDSSEQLCGTARCESSSAGKVGRAQVLELGRSPMLQKQT